ncbi:MAG: polysaccharide deacetylase family protein [candidate division Zixibacteria bacterium]|nr:polysaccharide deacetylase family protein [candidate division Zixibacteria bacterium]
MTAGLLTLAFHQTSDRFFPGINNVPPRMFFAILDLLTAWGLELRADSGSETGKTSAAMLTFDDGYEDNFAVLEAVCRRGIRPWLFVPTETIGESNRWDYAGRFFPARHLSAEQIRRLSAMGVIIGSHGVSHRSLTAMNPERRTAELIDSRKTLEDLIGKPVDSLSFPFGRFDDAVVAGARRCGFTTGFGLDRILPLSDDNLSFIRRRHAIYGNDNYYSLRNRLVRHTLWEAVKTGITWRLAGGTTAISPALK